MLFDYLNLLTHYFTNAVGEFKKDFFQMFNVREKMTGMHLKLIKIIKRIEIIFIHKCKSSLLKRSPVGVGQT